MDANKLSFPPLPRRSPPDQPARRGARRCHDRHGGAAFRRALGGGARRGGRRPRPRGGGRAAGARAEARRRGAARRGRGEEARDAGARAWLRELLDALYELGDARDDFRRAADAAARRQREEGRRSVWSSSNLSIPLMNCEFEKRFSQMNWEFEMLCSNEYVCAARCRLLVCTSADRAISSYYF